MTLYAAYCMPGALTLFLACDLLFQWPAQHDLPWGGRGSVGSSPESTSGQGVNFSRQLLGLDITSP